MAITLDGTNGINSSGVIVAPDGSASAPAITNDGDTNTGIFFPAADTIAFAEGGAEAMRIDSSGNVGIGTSNPGQKLELAGTTSTTGLKVTTTTATTYSQYTNTGGDFYIGRERSDGGGFGAPAYSSVLYSTGAYPMSFWTNAIERARIDSSGNLLVGTTSQINAGLLNLAFNTGVNCGIATRPTNNAGYDAARFFNSSTTQIGSISCTTTATAYNTSSDYRLKENIAPMTGALATVAQLNPVTYTWKADGSASQGFIAHELQKVVPECVSGEKDAVNEDGSIKPQGIDTSFLVATLTAAIQELSAKNDALEARIAALEGAQA
jgi:hypothetical protein